MHTKLIKANIALFEGERSETRRLLQEYRDERGQVWENDPEASMIMWLEAQAQGDRDERIRRLHALVASVEPEDYYAQLARDYLLEEEKYWQKIHSSPDRRTSGFTVLGVSLWKVIAFCVVGGVLAFIVFSMLSGAGDDPSQAVDAQPLDQADPTSPALPDRSQPLLADSYTARYPGGILQAVALEDDSERVVSTRTLTLAEPVPGARFYALDVVFECRIAICNHPPEAELALQLDNGVVEVRSDLAIAGERIFEPIALGRTTAGWIVFEVPTISRVDALVITASTDDVSSEPVVITLKLP